MGYSILARCCVYRLAPLVFLGRLASHKTGSLTFGAIPHRDVEEILDSLISAMPDIRVVCEYFTIPGSHTT